MSDVVDITVLPQYQSYLDGLLLWNIFNVVNLLCGLFILYLVYKIDKYNGYILTIISMTISQMIYNVGLLFTNVQGQWEDVFHYFFAIYGTLASSLWSLIICVVLSYIIISRNYFDMKHYFLHLSIFVFIYASWDAVYAAAAKYYYHEQTDLEQQIYWKEQFSIRFDYCNQMRQYVIYANVLFILILWIYVRSLYKDTSNPIYLFLYRLSYYPLAQICSRFPVMVYTNLYTNPWSRYQFQTITTLPLLKEVTATQTTWYILSSFTAPSTAIGNLLGFIASQPEALLIIKNLILRLLGKEVKEVAKLSSVALNYALRAKDAVENKVEKDNDVCYLERDSDCTSNSSNSFYMTSFGHVVHLTAPVVSMKSFIEDAVVESDGRITLSADRDDEMVDVYDVEKDSQMKTINNKIAINKDLNYDELDEEQLVRHIILQNYLKKQGDKLNNDTFNPMVEMSQL